MPRAQNAHAYVNAGFLLQMNDQRDKVIKSTIVYGNIHPEVSQLPILLKKISLSTIAVHPRYNA